jgi:hypothetical protein
MEMILRFFAFLYHADSYRAPMKDFLNRYMAKNRNLRHQKERQLSLIFAKTVDTIAEAIGPRAFRPVRAINAAAIDSLMTGVAQRLESGPIKKPSSLARQYKELMNNKVYRDAIETGTSQEEKVSQRITLATKAFAKVK